MAHLVERYIAAPAAEEEDVIEVKSVRQIKALFRHFKAEVLKASRGAIRPATVNAAAAKAARATGALIEMYNARSLTFVFWGFFGMFCFLLICEHRRRVITLCRLYVANWPRLMLQNLDILDLKKQKSINNPQKISNKYNVILTLRVMRTPRSSAIRCFCRQRQRIFECGRCDQWKHSAGLATSICSSIKP